MNLFIYFAVLQAKTQEAFLGSPLMLYIHLTLHPSDFKAFLIRVFALLKQCSVFQSTIFNCITA